MTTTQTSLFLRSARILAAPVSSCVTGCIPPAKISATTHILRYFFLSASVKAIIFLLWIKLYFAVLTLLADSVHILLKILQSFLCLYVWVVEAVFLQPLWVIRLDRFLMYPHLYHRASTLVFHIYLKPVGL